IIRHTRLSCDWSSDVCSSDLEHTSELQSHDNLVCRLLLTRLSCDWSLQVCSRSEENKSELTQHDNILTLLEVLSSFSPYYTRAPTLQVTPLSERPAASLRPPPSRRRAYSRAHVCS